MSSHSMNKDANIGFQKNGAVELHRLRSHFGMKFELIVEGII